MPIQNGRFLLYCQIRTLPGRVGDARIAVEGRIVESARPWTVRTLPVTADLSPTVDPFCALAQTGPVDGGQGMRADPNPVHALGGNDEASALRDTSRRDQRPVSNPGVKGTSQPIDDGELQKVQRETTDNNEA